MVSLAERDRSVTRLGFWSAVMVALAVVLFALALLIPLPVRLDFMASCVLAPAFVVMMTSIHYYTPPNGRIWSHLGLAFALMYAVMCTMSYFVQLAVVPYNSLGVSDDALMMFVFTPGSVVFAQDMLGYTFMCLATLAAAPAFAGGKLERWLKWLFVVHGLLFAPTLVSTLLLPTFSASGTQAASQAVDQIGTIALLVWAAVFIPLPVLLAVLFHKHGKVWELHSIDTAQQMA